MKTKIILTLILTFAFGGLLSVSAQPARQEQRIQATKQKRFSRTDVNVRFVGLMEDSRCPENARCVWAGNARIRLEVKGKGAASQIIELNTNVGDKSARYNGLLIELVDLSPGKRTNAPIRKNSYVATIAVSRLTR